MAVLKLRYDLRCATEDVAVRADLYSTALEQIAWADKLGFESVMLHEHHGMSDGYLPSPIVMAAAVAARTKAIRIVLGALIVPLHDPLRLAEDLAVVDLISKGRLTVIPAVGYAPEEFVMFGRLKSQRGSDLERGINTLRQAWTGEPFEYEGRVVTVTPRPFQRPHPPMSIGGGSQPAARRAARIGDGFAPHIPEAWDYYREALQELGRPDPGPMPPSTGRFLYVSDDPERSWVELAPYLLHEMNAYGELASQANEVTGYEQVADIAALRRSPHYRILTPNECIELLNDLGPGATLTLHPLAGGMPPELSWAGLHRFESEVLPHLAGKHHG